MNRYRSAAVAASLALALVVPGSALAANVTGTTTETFSLSSSVSMTAPASVTYTTVGATASGKFTLSNIATNAVAGVTVTGQFYDFTGPALISANKRTLGTSDAPTGGIIAGDVKYPAIVDQSTPVVILLHPSALAASRATWGMEVAPVTVPGTYSGSIDFNAVTN